MAGSAAVAGHAAKTRKKKESQFSLVMKRLRKNKLAMAGLVIILILFAVALLAPWIMPYAYDEMNMLERLQVLGQEIFVLVQKINLIGSFSKLFQK